MKKTMRILTTLFVFSLLPGAYGQSGPQAKPQLTVEKIMQDPDQWIGTLPENASWAHDNKTFYFYWKKDTAGIRQLYKATAENPKPLPVPLAEKKKIIPVSGIFNKARDKELYTDNGDIFLYDLRSKTLKQLTFTTAYERALRFSDPDTAIFYLSENNIFSLTFTTGEIRQLTDFRKGKKSAKKPEYAGKNEAWLHNQQLQLFEVLRERKKETEARQREREKEKAKAPKIIYTGKSDPSGTRISPDGRYITWLIYHKPSHIKQTEIPHFVNESGYTSIQHSRAKVGTPYFTQADLYIRLLRQHIRFYRFFQI